MIILTVIKPKTQCHPQITHQRFPGIKIKTDYTTHISHVILEPDMVITLFQLQSFPHSFFVKIMALKSDKFIKSGLMVQVVKLFHETVDATCRNVDSFPNIPLVTSENC